MTQIETIAKKFITLFYQLILGSPKKTIFLYCFFTLLLAIPTLIIPIEPFPHLRTKTGTVHLLSDVHHAGKAFKEYVQKFGTPEVLIVVLESDPKNLPQLKPYLKAISKEVEKEKEFVKGQRYRLPIEFLKEKGLYFLSKLEWAEFQKELAQLRMLVNSLNGAPNLIGFFTFMSKSLQGPSIPSTQNQITEENISDLKRFRQFLQIAVNKKTLTPKENPFLTKRQQKSFNYVDEEGYFVIKRKGVAYLLLFIEPTNQTNDFEFNEKFVNRIKQNVKKVKTPPVDFQVGYTGSPALNVAEMRDSRKDLFVGGCLSFILVFIFFVGLYHRFPLRPVCALFCLGLGILWTFGFTAFYPGHLNLLSMTFALLLIGLGIDFGIHFISRYNEELQQLLDSRQAIDKTLLHLSPALIISALSTCGAFFTTVFTDFKGFSELGFIAGIGVLTCLFLMLTLLPTLLLVVTKKKANNVSEKRWYSFLTFPFSFILKACAMLVSIFVFLFQKVTSYLLPKILYRRHWIVFLIALFLTLFFSYSASYLHYDKNILNLQSKNSPEVDYMRKILAIGEFGVLLYKTEEEEYSLPEFIEKLRYQGYQKNTFSIQDIVPPNQQEQKQNLDTLKGELRVYYIKEHRNFNEEELSPQLETLNEQFVDYRRLALKAQAGPFGLELANVIDDGETGIIPLLEEIEEGLEEEDFVLFLNQFSTQYLEQLQQMLNQLEALCKATPFTAEELPTEFKDIFMSKDGQYRLIQVYPRGDIFDGETLEEFVEHLQQISPRATGHPVMVHEMVKSIREGYEDAGWMALAVISIITLVSFRSFRYTLLSLASVIIGITWTFGILALIPQGNLNPGNMIALPLILGIGIDNAVHLIHRYREEKSIEKSLNSTGKAIITSSLTTIFGFIGLCIGHHQGLASLGQTLILGMFCCLISCLIVLPTIVTMSIDLRNWLSKSQED